VVAVNFKNEPKSTVSAFAKREAINYPILLDGNSVGQKYGVRGIPTTFYLDPEGRIVSSEVGAEQESEMEAKVKAILPRTSAAGG
jgi:hypothetical protein